MSGFWVSQTSLNLLQPTQPSVNFLSRSSKFQAKNNKHFTRCHQTITYGYLAFSLHKASKLWGLSVIRAQPSRLSLISSNVSIRNTDFPFPQFFLLRCHLFKSHWSCSTWKSEYLWPRILSCPRPRSENSHHSGKVRWSNHHHFLCGTSCYPVFWGKPKPQVLFWDFAGVYNAEQCRTEQPSEFWLHTWLSKITFLCLKRLPLIILWNESLKQGVFWIFSLHQARPKGHHHALKQLGWTQLHDKAD